MLNKIDLADDDELDAVEVFERQSACSYCQDSTRENRARRILEVGAFSLDRALEDDPSLGLKRRTSARFNGWSVGIEIDVTRFGS